MTCLYPIYVRSGRSPNKYKAGFIDVNGRTVIDPNFEDARPFCEGIATVQLNGKWGAIDATGKLVVPYRFSSIGLRFSEGLAQFGEGALSGLLAADGTVVVRPKYLAISDFRESLAFVRDLKQHCGFISRQGEEVIPPFFENARMFNNGLAPVQLGGKWGYIDARARFVVEPRFDGAQTFSEGLACVSVDGRWGYIDLSGNFVIPPIFGDAVRFSEGLAVAAREPKGAYGYIDKSGEFVIQPAFVYTRQFSEGLAAVTLEERSIHHFIDRDGARAFPGTFLDVESFEQGLCLVSTMKTIAYIDRQGRTVWEGPYVTKM